MAELTTYITIALALLLPQLIAGFKCPPGDNKVYPHETNCSQYYVCDHGNAHLRECPKGLHFNRKTKQCDWPRNAGCETLENSHLDRAFNYNSKYCDDGTLYPHEDCSKYYDCVGGSKIERDCPEGLHFSVKKQQCDWPREAGCEKRMGNNRDSKYCDDDTLYPHEDCSKYYACVGGEKIERDCPEGLHFSVKKQQCDWPEEAGCEKRLGNNLDSKYCDDGTLYPHEDCSKYYACVGGEKIVMECPAGLHFSVKKQQCDWPEEAGCKKVVLDLVLENFAADVCEHDGLYPHKSDCTKYYLCSYNHLHEMDCPKGLHFNAKAKYCDYPKNAGCDPNA